LSLTKSGGLTSRSRLWYFEVFIMLEVYRHFAGPNWKLELKNLLKKN